MHFIRLKVRASYCIGQRPATHEAILYAFGRTRNEICVRIPSHTGKLAESSVECMLAYPANDHPTKLRHVLALFKTKLKDEFRVLEALQLQMA
jgi:hypothetical protein